jgi:hypothetical protein
MMPIYVIESTDPKNLGHIRIHLCPYFGRGNATITIQSVSTVANIEILNEDDYILFREYLGKFLQTEVEVQPLPNARIFSSTYGLEAGWLLKNRHAALADFTFDSFFLEVTRMLTTLGIVVNLISSVSP